MDLYIDTKKLEEHGKDIMMLSNDLSNVVNEMFDRLTKMTTQTFEWYGDAAVEYEKIVKVEKEGYVTATNEIYNLGKTLETIANNYESAIKANEIKK